MKKTLKQRNELIPFSKLRSMSVAQLKKIGCAEWEKSKHGTLMLFPKDWYSKIPNGYTITDIGYQKEKFKRGKTDNDHRFGFLSYGVLIKLNHRNVKKK